MNIWQQMENCKDSFTPKEQEIYELIKKDPYPFTSSTAMSIASRYSIPQSALSRFCQKIGFSGFTEFRLSMMVAASTMTFPGSGVAQNRDVPSNPTKQELSGYLSGLIQQTNAALTDECLLSLAKRVLKSRTVYSTGHANSYPAAYLLTLRLILASQSAHTIQPGLEMETLHIMGPEDLVFLFSVSNATHRDLLSLVEDMDPKKRPYIVLVCCSRTHPLRRKVNEVVTLPSWQSLQYPYMVDTSVPQIAFCNFLSTTVNTLLEEGASTLHKCGPAPAPQI